MIMAWGCSGYYEGWGWRGRGTAEGWMVAVAAVVASAQNG
jgi:hypothetical protein